MTSDHDWRECRPPITFSTTSDGAHARPVPPEVARIAQTILAVWESLTDVDREAFHNYCCLGSLDAADLAAVVRISQILRLELTVFALGPPDGLPPALA
jgi:hypothetical protein